MRAVYVLYGWIHPEHTEEGAEIRESFFFRDSMILMTKVINMFKIPGQLWKPASKCP